MTCDIQVLDEDDMASDSATAVPSQQSVAAFVRNREAFRSVKDYGVKGDGSTDDAANLETAFSSGGMLYVPEGDYKIETSIHAVVTESTYIMCHPDARFYRGTRGSPGARRSAV